MLDKLAIQMERNKLSIENTKLANALRKFIDSQTIPERLKRKYNILVVGSTFPCYNGPFKLIFFAILYLLIFAERSCDQGNSIKTYKRSVN